MSMDVSRLLSLAVTYSRQNDLPVHFDRYRQFLDELDGIHRHPFVGALEKRSQIPIDLVLQRFFRFSRTPQVRHQRRPHPRNRHLQWLLSLTKQPQHIRTEQLRELQRLRNAENGFEFRVLLLQIAIAINSEAKFVRQFKLTAPRLEPKSPDTVRDAHLIWSTFLHYAVSCWPRILRKKFDLPGWSRQTCAVISLPRSTQQSRFGRNGMVSTN